MFKDKIILYFIIILSTIITLILCISLPLYFVYKGNEDTNLLINMERTRNTYKNRLENVLETYTTFTELMGNFFSVKNDISYEEFIYLSNTIIFSSKGVIQAISFVPLVNHTYRDEIENKASIIYNKTLNITGLVNGDQIISYEKDFYFPVYYIFPIKDNENALLFDIYSNLERKKAIDKSIITRNVSVSDGLTLVQGDAGVLELYPIFDNKLIGLTSFVYNLNSLLLSAFRDLEKINNMKINLYNDRVSEWLVSLRYNGSFIPIFNQKFQNKSSISNDIKFADSIWRLDIHIPENNNLELSDIILIICFSLLIVICSIIIIGFMFLKKYLNQQQYLTRLERYNSYISKMVNYVNHEVRNPLNSILGMIEIVKNELNKRVTGFDTSYLLKNLSIAHNSCILIKHVVDDVLDVKKLEEEKLEINNSHINIQKFTTNLKSLLSTQIQEKPYIKFSIETEIDTMWSDSYRITQILLNLIINAYKFTDEGFIKLKIERETENSVLFSVIDTGKGVKDKDLLFKPFVKSINNDIVSRQVGSGLGLYLCKMIVELMGGTVGFDDNIEKGSIFFFILPQESKNK